MRITSKGQVTIPQAVRERAGLLPGSEVDFILEPDGAVRIVKVRGAAETGRGRMVIEALRRNRANFTMTTEEVMALTRGED